MQFVSLFIAFGRHSRVTVLHEVVDELLSYHDDGQLNAKLGETTSRIANVTLQLEKLIFSCSIIAGIIVEASFEERNVNQRTVKRKKCEHCEMKRT